MSGRELHEFLGVKTAYKDWFPRMVEYGFIAGEDFNPVKIDRVQNEGGRRVTRSVENHQLTIPMAKELCLRRGYGQKCPKHTSCYSAINI